jgi:hypothetical protein
VVGILDLIVYESDDDIVVGGFGVTNKTFLSAIPSQKAG